MNKIKLFAAGAAAGPYFRQFLGLSEEEAIEGLKNAFGVGPTVMNGGLAWFDPERGEVVTQPRLSANYAEPVKADLTAIRIAVEKATAVEQPVLKPFSGGVDVFFEAMDEEENER